MSCTEGAAAETPRASVWDRFRESDAQRDAFVARFRAVYSQCTDTDRRSDTRDAALDTAPALRLFSSADRIALSERARQRGNAAYRIHLYSLAYHAYTEALMYLPECARARSNRAQTCLQLAAAATSSQRARAFYAQALQDARDACALLSGGETDHPKEWPLGDVCDSPTDRQLYAKSCARAVHAARHLDDAQMTAAAALSACQRVAPPYAQRLRQEMQPHER
ncbi:hypothetical protein CDCA_CDCA19G4665 [Cyanidium caldarium]|uniref:Uncharacterized protein n=1 Tax=Cyanidium caldarium TaxID=2771 RepID=A0AAV9J234_CYACA|nr:hypothetical protein CDCA_CDCA19G4665 [Cyanidium caldarium]